MSPLTSALERYRPALFALTALVAGCVVYYVQNPTWSLTSSQPSVGQNALHRSNAQRRRRSSREAEPPASPIGAEQVAPDEGTVQTLPVTSTRPAGALPSAEHDESNSGQQVLEEGRETIVDAESEHSWRDEIASATEPDNEALAMLHLLYRIAEDAARKEGYVHRRVTCNRCNITPIRGIRYRCANCVDYSLCEMCESLQIHHKMHVFYKIRIPAPFVHSPRDVQPVWYPGTPSPTVMRPQREVLVKYSSQTEFSPSEVEALWEQFRCLAGTTWDADPDEHKLAIDRVAFDKCFVPHISSRPPPPNLILDRMFDFYDSDCDGLIGFGDFITGLSSLTKQSWNERRKKVFDAYDINKDGYVDRKDFLRIFRALYALKKEMTRDVIDSMDDEERIDAGIGEARQIVMSSQAVSAAFGPGWEQGERRRTGEGKMQDENGDSVIRDNGATVRESSEDIGDKNEVVADVFESIIYNRVSNTVVSADYKPFDESMIDEENEEDWPPAYVTAQDVFDALDRSVDFEEVEDLDDRQKVRLAAERRRAVRELGVKHRWERQQFYTDDEDGVLPPDGFEQDATAENQPPSRRSRSSSKVRFQDDLGTNDEHEIRSATSMSSRSIPVGESWGGYEVPVAERYVGREILYQVAQESLNELLDPIFLQREDLAILARRKRTSRELHRPQISAYATDAILANIKKQMDNIQWKFRIKLTTKPLQEADLYHHLKENLKLAPNDSTDTNPAAHPSFITPTTEDAGASSRNAAPDPTLPQYRPNSVPLTCGNLSSSLTPPPQSLSIDELNFHIALDLIEAEDVARGGPGRMSFSEFEDLFRGKRREELGFVGSWVELATF